VKLDPAADEDRTDDHQIMNPRSLPADLKDKQFKLKMVCIYFLLYLTQLKD
jgi:hypothetical protein